MGLLDRSTECCGANLKSERISVLGMLTLSLPLIFLSWILLPLLYPIKWIGLDRIYQIMVVVYRANMSLVQDSSLFPNLKCTLSGKLYKFSPMLSGLNFKFFNLVVLSGFFFTVLGSALIVIRVWPSI